MKNKFTNKEQLVEYARELVPWAEGKESSIMWEYQKAQEKLKTLILIFTVKIEILGVVILLDTICKSCDTKFKWDKKLCFVKVS